MCNDLYIYKGRKGDFTMKKRIYARKGFTLVELLIVIVVIGILSAMMMLSSTEAMSSAKASNIASNLRNIKTATLAWYADHTDWVSPDLKVNIGTKTDQQIHQVIGTGDNQANILKYFNNEGSITLKGSSNDGSGEYVIRAVDNTGGTTGSKRVWYVGYVFTEGEKNNVREKLAGRAKTLGLKFGTKDAGSLTTTADGKNAVWLLVLGTPES